MTDFDAQWSTFGSDSNRGGDPAPGIPQLAAAYAPGEEDEDHLAALRKLQEEVGLYGDSPQIFQILETIEQVAPTDITVLISGESGTGKELVAKAIHARSRRRTKPLVVVNCGAIPEGVLESELFGHEKGAFTHAIASRKGYFEIADGGTIFLDEIGDMPLSVQVKILRVLEGREFMRVGGSAPLKVDVRLIAATNKDLESAVRRGEFRQDLYYRLNAITVRVPPLRERPGDVRILARKFAADFCRENKIEFEGFTESAFLLMERHPWPGNVRELKNLVESVIVLERGRKIDEYVLSKYLAPQYSPDRNMPVPVNRPPEEVEREFLYRALLDLREQVAEVKEILLGRHPLAPRPPAVVAPPGYIPEAAPEPVQEVQPASSQHDGSIVQLTDGMTLQEVEKIMIHRTLEKTGGNKRKAAKLLGISERTLYRKIKEYDLPF
jgi:DNA-binding NtrC family response regulator